MGGVPFSFAGAAPEVEGEIFPLRFPGSAGNLHLVLYCRTLPTWQELPLVCSALCKGGLAGFWSPSRRPASHRQCEMASISLP